MADLPAKPPSLRDDALAVLTRLREAGHVAYFAGGCVRDLLLGLEAKDYDIATDAPPGTVRKLFPNTQAVGAAFGVILVRHRKSTIEVATFRSDGNYADGRRPESVRFTTAEEDAQRRDFTINGLFLDPIENKVIDYVGGQADLAARVIRAIGDPEKRFHEDHLRLLRAVRFAARLNFTIDERTTEAIKREAPNLKRISPERIADELRRMLTAYNRAYAWRCLYYLGLSKEIFRSLDFGGSPLLFMVLDLPINISFSLALATTALGHQFGTKPIVALLERSSVTKTVRTVRTLLKISNDESEGMEQILLDAGAALQGWTLAQRMRFMARPTARETRQLLAAIAVAEKEHQATIAALEESLRPLENVDCAPTPLITGDDLTAAGWPPGPVFKRVLETVYDAQLEGRVKTKDQAMDLAVSLRN
jgi:tRNA nucleotidyltransferase/poly(A) polymerase